MPDRVSATRKHFRASMIVYAHINIIIILQRYDSICALRLVGCIIYIQTIVLCQREGIDTLRHTATLCLWLGLMCLLSQQENI